MEIVTGYPHLLLIAQPAQNGFPCMWNIITGSEHIISGPKISLHAKK